MTTHSLHQQIDDLTAALEQDKKPIGFLIGAGASMSVRPGGTPLIPDLIGLTVAVREKLPKALSTSLDLLISQLSDADGKSLESILNYVRALAALPGDSDVRGVSLTTLQELDESICSIVRDLVDKELPSGSNGFLDLALWVAAVSRLHPVHMFTTNYDLLLEQALEAQRVSYFDGFMGSYRPIFDIEAIEEDALPVRWTFLWKLHGSINWSMDTDGFVTRDNSSSPSSPAIIYPSHLKYDQSRRLPYLAMMDRLKAFLRKPGAVLFTTGYSFNDQHINEVIEQSLRSNPTATVQSMLHGNLDQYTQAVVIASRTSNVVLLAADSGVVSTRTGTWESQLVEGKEESVKFDLGDFAAFGAKLRELIGVTRESESRPVDA